MFFKIRRRKRISRARLYAAVFFISLAVGVTLIVRAMNEKMAPVALAIIEKTVKNEINANIDSNVRGFMEENDIQSSDFFERTTDADGMTVSLSVNTALVNDICGRVASGISDGLATIGERRVKVPFGSVFNTPIFANSGPRYPIRILPAGGASVDYETKFESVGINQTNFQLWLQVDTYVNVMNPLRDADMTLSRKIALVNTVFSGKVPNTYLENTPIATPVE
ncbi:MAG: sporulation protein YunB [Clostridiales bacterium]|jgi:sporulation protein YunB|nr:sporulation protein YunB [Clostridiales bacterium]